MEITCKQCSAPFKFTDEDQKFLKKVSPEFKGKTIPVPPPTLCPQCRVQRRLTCRNDRTFYKRKCDHTDEEFVSIYAPDSPYTVFRPSAWYGDGWDPMDDGRKFDFNRPFFDQFDDLMKDVPQLGIDIVNCENSEFCNYCGDDKSCYLDIAGEANEDCYFNLFIKYSKNCADSTFCYHSTLLYECIQCYNCYSCRHSMYLDDCSDCAFCYDCKGCKNCLLCTNLRNKEYCVLNKEHTKEEYEQKLKELNMGCNSSLKNVFGIWNKMRIENGIYRDMYTINCENCTGNNIKNAKNCHSSYNASDCEDCKYLYDVLDAKDCQDLNYSLYKPEPSYELCSTLQMRHSAFCYASHYCDSCYYGVMLNHCNDCFGCVALRHKKYCIFNKQYSKEEYEELVPKIIEHMVKNNEFGEFFPGAVSPFSYNETVAHEYYPLTEQIAQEREYKWRHQEKKAAQKQKIEIPDCIVDVPESITEDVLLCRKCGKNYRIIPQELKLYKQLGVPVPHACPDCRHLDRFKLRNPRRLWNQSCKKCEKDIQSSYLPERPERVVCEGCYLKEVY
jgi:hypothetical protein